MPEIRAGRDGVVQVRLDRQEADLMRSLLDEVTSILEPDAPRNDPVVERLFPDAFESAKDSRAYRELVGDDLRAEKMEALITVGDKLGDSGRATFPLEAGVVDAWLTVLTDLRLALGTRLGVTEETMEEEPDTNDPDAPAKAVLHWLGWLQEMTISELTKKGGEG